MKSKLRCPPKAYLLGLLLDAWGSTVLVTAYFFHGVFSDD